MVVRFISLLGEYIFIGISSIKQGHESFFVFTVPLVVLQNNKFRRQDIFYRFEIQASPFSFLIEGSCVSAS
jgi:hypothetical protein